MNGSGLSLQHQNPEFAGIPLDRNAVAQDLLNIDKKLRSNLFPWNGQFSPQLIELLLRTYAPERGLVLDPFAGSGTVLYEAGSLEMPVVGSEINPAACKMAQLFCLMNLAVTNRNALAHQLEYTLQDCLPTQKLSLFGTNGQAADTGPKETLVEILGELHDEPTRAMLEALIVLVDFYKEVTSEKILAKWAKLKSRILTLPESASPVRFLNCDARSLPLGENEIDFVVTSPPYINVFNYHQQYRRSVEALGWDLLEVARSEIGSNRKHRQNRFLTVVQYCLDMADVLRELQRVCKDGSRIIMVMGRVSNVRKTRFFNGEIMATLASRCLGFAVMLRQERLFMNRFGEHIYEDILHFEVKKGNALEEARVIGREVLLKAKKRAPDESLSDLEEALLLAGEVQASPPYDVKAANSRFGREARKAVTK